jgi:HEAT repeat protein
MCSSAVAQTWDALLQRATRDAETEEGRVAKEAFLGGGAVALRFVMDNAHYRNVGIHILLDEMVRTYDDPSGAEVLAEFLPSPHARTRKVAAYYMGYFDAPDLTDRVRPLLADNYVRAMAIRTLGKWKSTNDVPRIVACLDDPQERVRIAAANALRDIGDERAAMGLIMALDDPVFTVRNCAERALRGLGGETDELLYAAADEASPQLLRYLVRLMGERGRKSMAAPLKVYLASADWGTRGDAARALGLLEPESLDIWAEGSGSAEQNPFVRAALGDARADAHPPE